MCGEGGVRIGEQGHEREENGWKGGYGEVGTGM